MSTNALIFVKIPKELRGKSPKFDINKLPNGVCDFSYPRAQSVDYKPPRIVFPKLNNNNDDELYLCVYHHWDGYIDNLGKHLLEYYKTFDKALNLCLGGDMSTCMHEGDKVVYYYNAPSSWNKRYAPRKVSDLAEFMSINAQQYNYLFSDGQWFLLSQDGLVYESLEDKVLGLNRTINVKS